MQRRPVPARTLGTSPHGGCIVPVYRIPITTTHTPPTTAPTPAPQDRTPLTTTTQDAHAQHRRQQERGENGENGATPCVPRNVSLSPAIERDVSDLLLLLRALSPASVRSVAAHIRLLHRECSQEDAAQHPNPHRHQYGQRRTRAQDDALCEVELDGTTGCGRFVRTRIGGE